MSSSNHWPYRLALITGAGSGLGRAIACAIAQKGTALILVGRDVKKLDETASLLSVSPILMTVDLAKRDERQKLIAAIQAHTPDLIINNAGFGLYGDAVMTAASEQLELIEVNVAAVVEISLEAARALLHKSKTGTVMNISSAASFFSYPGFAAYAASKAFVNRFSEALDYELSPHGIRVLTVCPGQIETGFRHRASGGHPQQTDSWTLSPQKAVRLIMEQIQELSPLKIIDWRYRLAIFCTRFVPKRILMRFLKKTIDQRRS